MMATAPRTWRDPILWLILAGSLVLNVRGIDHPGLHYCDESFHAIVARNLLKHPLKPTLIDVPYLAYNPTHWGENHVWLHKPTLPLWTIAGSFALLGVNTLALRLPSALLASASVGLTFLIGRRLFDRPTGLVAASIQAINPSIARLVQGYLFSDHVDISLLFWVEVGVYFVVRASQTGEWPDVLAVGLAQGLAYLSKSYLAALLIGLAATAWLLPRISLVSLDQSRWKLRHLAGLVAATLATVAPWTLYCAWAYPVEFAHEHGYVFTHLGQGVENWGGPWDRLFFDHLIGLNHGFYTPLIVAWLVLLPSTLASRRLSNWLPYVWLFGVLAPHAVAATKTPSATLIALPAGFLLVARLMVEGWRGAEHSPAQSTALPDDFRRAGLALPLEAENGRASPALRERFRTSSTRSLAAWTAIMAVVALSPSRIGRFSRGFPQPPRFGGVMLQATWVFEQLAIAGAIFAAIELISWAWSRRKSQNPTTSFRSRNALRVAALGFTLVVGFRLAMASKGVTEGSEGSEDRPFVTELAAFAARERLPANAVFLFDATGKGDHQNAMFLLDRTCYLLQGRSPEELARQIQNAGGIPYVVTARPPEPIAWNRVFAGTQDPRSVYQWRGSEVAGGSLP